MLSLPRARPHQLGESHCGSGVRGTDLSRSGQRCIDAPGLRKFNWGAIGSAHVLYAETFVRDGAQGAWIAIGASCYPVDRKGPCPWHEILEVFHV